MDWDDPVPNACPFDDDIMILPGTQADIEEFLQLVRRGEFEEAHQLERNTEIVDPGELWKTQQNPAVLRALIRFYDAYPFMVQDGNLLVEPLAYSLMHRDNLRFDISIQHAKDSLDSIINDDNPRGLLAEALRKRRPDYFQKLIRAGADPSITEGIPPLNYAETEAVARKLLKAKANVIGVRNSESLAEKLLRKFPNLRRLVLKRLLEQSHQRVVEMQSSLLQNAVHGAVAFEWELEHGYFSQTFRDGLEEGHMYGNIVARHPRPNIDRFSLVWKDWRRDTRDLDEFIKTRGAPLNIRDRRGITALSAIAERGLVDPNTQEIHRAFLVPGLNFNVEDRDGRNIHSFLNSEFPCTVSSSTKALAIRDLNALIEASTGEQFAFLVAVRDNHVDRALSILEGSFGLSVDVNFRYPNRLVPGEEFTALSVAVYNGFGNMVEVLLEHGADPNGPIMLRSPSDERDRSNLQIALKQKFPDVAESLIRHGARIANLPGGTSPLTMAMENKYYPLVHAIAERLI